MRVSIVVPDRPARLGDEVGGLREKSLDDAEQRHGLVLLQAVDGLANAEHVQDGVKPGAQFRRDLPVLATQPQRGAHGGDGLGHGEHGNGRLQYLISAHAPTLRAPRRAPQRGRTEGTTEQFCGRMGAQGRRSLGR